MSAERRRYRPPTILLTLDGAPTSLAALPVARRLAELANATLHIVYVAPHALPLEALRVRLALPEDQLRGLVLDEVEGEPVEAIVGLAKERASLMIVMTRARETTHETGLGHVAAGVLTAAPCPVLLVPPSETPSTWQMKRILLPQDGTPESAAAGAAVVHLARRAGAEVVVVHVYGRGVAPPEPGSLPVPRYMDQPQHEWPEWVGEFIERIRGLCHREEASLRFFLAHGEAGQEIVHLAAEKQLDLIALFWRGNFGPGRATTVKTVIRDAPCPVLVLPFDTLSRLDGQLRLT